jgi:hypothetical protein
MMNNIFSNINPLKIKINRHSSSYLTDHCGSVRKTNQQLLYWEIIDISCQNREECTSTLWTKY